jgi:hypothetical protein
LFKEDLIFFLYVFYITLKEQTMIYKKMATRAALLTLLSTSTLLGDAITPCYTTDWTTPHLPQWVKYIPILTQKERILCLEVGSYEGRSTTWIAKNFATQQESKVLAIDPMGAYYGYEEGGPRACEPTMYETFMNNTKDLRDAGKIFLIREPSQTAWSMIFDGARGVKGGKARGVKVDEVRGVRVDEVRRLRFDEVRGIRTGIPDVYFIFLDGEHAGPTAIEDLVAAWDVLQPGGILVIDDYELTMCYHSFGYSMSKDLFEQIFNENPKWKFHKGKYVKEYKKTLFE